MLMIISDNGANVVKAVKNLQLKETDRKMKQYLEKFVHDSSKATASHRMAESGRGEEPGSGNQESENEGNTEAEEMSDNETDSATVSGDNCMVTESDDSEEDSDSDPENSQTYDKCHTDNESDLALAIDDDDTNFNETFLPFPDNVPFRRMPCMAHTLQLVVKGIYKTTYMRIITKTRHLVGQIRKSSVAVEKLVNICGKNVVSDCTTRWNSTYLMTKRLLEIRCHVNTVLGEVGVDTLLNSEWTKLEEMVQLLEPFATPTDVIQTDFMSLSLILPSLLDIQCHLQQFTAAKVVAIRMLSDMSQD
jgi:hypothetical protein